MKSFSLDESGEHYNNRVPIAPHSTSQGSSYCQCKNTCTHTNDNNKTRRRTKNEFGKLIANEFSNSTKLTISCFVVILTPFYNFLWLSLNLSMRESSLRQVSLREFVQLFLVDRRLTDLAASSSFLFYCWTNNKCSYGASTNHFFTGSL